MGTKVLTFKGEIEKFWNKPLSELAQKEGAAPVVPPLKFEGSYKAYESIEDVRTANDYPSDEEVVKFRNTQRKANERQKAMLAAVQGAGFIQPTIENDDQLRLSKMYDLFIANKNTHEEARAKAAAALGLEWADDSE